MQTLAVGDVESCELPMEYCGHSAGKRFSDGFNQEYRLELICAFMNVAPVFNGTRHIPAAQTGKRLRI